MEKNYWNCCWSKTTTRSSINSHVKSNAWTTDDIWREFTDTNLCSLSTDWSVEIFYYIYRKKELSLFSEFCSSISLAADIRPTLWWPRSGRYFTLISATFWDISRRSSASIGSGSRLCSRTTFCRWSQRERSIHSSDKNLRCKLRISWF